MDIEALQTFLAIAENGSFSRAAERIFLTQPAISKRIAALEAELGAKLFDRVGRRVQLTPAGTALLPQARSILDGVGEAKRRIAALSRDIAGPLRLGTSYHVGLHRLPPALRQFYPAHPNVQLDLRFMDSEAACHAVEQGDLDLAVVTLPHGSNPRLHKEKIWDDPLEIVVAATHPLAAAGQLHLPALVEYPVILPVPGTTTREIVLAALAPVRRHLLIGLETNYLELIKMLVSVGLGWSALPHTLIDGDLKVVQIEGIGIIRELGVVTHAARTLSNAASAIIEAIRATR
ncbi:MAG: LysR family transcriptional regulator [Acidiferrobacterales bacterium]